MHKLALSQNSPIYLPSIHHSPDVLPAHTSGGEDADAVRAREHHRPQGHHLRERSGQTEGESVSQSVSRIVGRLREFHQSSFECLEMFSIGLRA